MATNEEQKDAAQVKEQQQKKATINKPVAQAKEPEQLIYIGPAVRNQGVAIRKYQIFIGGLPPYLKPLYDQYPLIAHLFVSVDTLGESTKKLKQTGSMLNTAYRSILEGV